MDLIDTPNQNEKKILIEHNYEIAKYFNKDTVNIKAKVLWLQLGIRSLEAKKIVEENKIEYVEDRCTKMEYQKHFLKVRQAFPVLQS